MAPMGFNIALPAMVGGHLLLGIAEAAVTSLVVAYVARTDPAMLSRHAGAPGQPSVERRGLWPKIAIGLGVLVVLSPLGLYVAGPVWRGLAWGEWSAQQMRGAGRIRAGPDAAPGVALARASCRLCLPGPDAPLWQLAVEYVLSAVIGVGVLVGLIMLVRWIVSRGKQRGPSAGVDAPADRA